MDEAISQRGEMESWRQCKDIVRNNLSQRSEFMGEIVGVVVVGSV